MHRKAIIIIVACTVAIVALSLFAWNFFSLQIPQKYEKVIYRNFDNSQEQTALAKAESIDYSTITSSNRFGGTNDPEDYLDSSNIAYTYANYIDSKVIDYYQARYENQQGQIFPRQIELNYEANASTFSQFRIYNSAAPEGVTWHNVTIVMSASNGTVEFNSGRMQFFYRNQTDYQITQWDYDFKFSDCYVINMKLSYYEIYAPTAGFFVTVHQIVVLDKNFEPVLVGLESGMAVS